MSNRNAYESFKILASSYSFRKTKTDNRNDEHKVEDAVSLVNGQIQQSVADADMPTSVMGVNMDWSVGTPDDAIYRASLGDWTGQQNVMENPVNIGLLQPTNIVASYNTAEEAVDLEWDEVSSGAGYRLYRDGTDPVNIIHDGPLSATGGKVSYTDNVGDNSEHTYYIIAVDADPEDNSDFSDPATGKGYSLFTETISLSGYQTQTVNTSASAIDMIVSGDIAGSRGCTGTDGYAYGQGAEGLGYTSSNISDGSHVIKFQSSSHAISAYDPGDGYFSGGSGPHGLAGGGGGASRILVDDTAICGAGGGGGAGAKAGSENNLQMGGGGGGGIYGAGQSVSGYNVRGSGGSGGGGNSGYFGDAASHGTTVVIDGSFTSTGTNNGSGYINATLTWKE